MIIIIYSSISLATANTNSPWTKSLNENFILLKELSYSSIYGVAFGIGYEKALKDQHSLELYTVQYTKSSKDLYGLAYRYFLNQSNKSKTLYFGAKLEKNKSFSSRLKNRHTNYRIGPQIGYQQLLSDHFGIRAESAILYNTNLNAKENSRYDHETGGWSKGQISYTLNLDLVFNF